MEHKLLGDPEFCLILEEEKRLCEKDVEFIKGTLKKGIGEKNGELVDEDISRPSIKLSRKLKHKELYKITDSISQWKLVTDVKGSKKLVAFLEVKFPKTKASELHFCFEMDLKLYRAGDERIITIENREYKATPYRFEKKTDTILQWLELLIETGGINIVDGEDPSIGIEGVPTDIPAAILGFFDEFIKQKNTGKEHTIVVMDKESLRKDFI